MSTEFFAFEEAETTQAEPAVTQRAEVATPAILPAVAEEPRAIPGAAIPGTWDGDIESLQARFPGTRLGTLFCIHKLEQDADLQLRDFKAEAELRGVPLSGRSFHGARVLLGLEVAKPRRARVVASEEKELADLTASDTGDSGREFGDESDSGLEDFVLPTSGGSDLESALRTAIEAATEQRTAGMRDAIRRAIAVLEEALED